MRQSLRQNDVVDTALEAGSRILGSTTRADDTGGESLATIEFAKIGSRDAVRTRIPSTSFSATGSQPPCSSWHRRSTASSKVGADKMTALYMRPYQGGTGTTGTSSHGMRWANRSGRLSISSYA